MLKSLFREYGKVIIAILIAVAVLVIILGGNFLRNAMASPAKKDTNIEHKANEEEFRDISYKLVPAVKPLSGSRRIAKDAVFNPLEAVVGVSYLVDSFGDVQYEQDADGVYVKERDDEGNIVLDKNGNSVYEKVVDTTNDVVVTVATTELKGQIVDNGETKETVTMVPDIRYRKTNSGEFELMKDIPDDVAKILLGTEKCSSHGKEEYCTCGAISLNPDHYATHKNNGSCECEFVDGKINKEEFFNAPGQYLVRYRAVDENNAEAFVEILFIVDGSLKTNEGGVLIGGSDR